MLSVRSALSSRQAPAGVARHGGGRVGCQLAVGRKGVWEIPSLADGPLQADR